MAPAMSMRCMTVPPRMKPSGLASLGRTTCTISVSESAARLGAGSMRAGSGTVSEVVAHPDREARFPELRAAAGGDEERLLPLLVEQCPPRPVEMQREAEDERLQADAVRRPAVPEPESGDRP